ncbi:MAG: NAAT family transporter [Candidatus Eremiobacteraeota bacterium]|nr:NAAT family transporter [Candidatus Eremiobacteraeota bacterium]
MRPWPEYVQVMLSLFAMCTAPALIPIFLGMTEHMTEARRKRTAFGVALTVVLALAFMIFFGEGLFRLMGISISAFQVGGGVLIFLSSLQMVNSTEEPEQKKAGPGPNNPTIVPLAIPIVAGPGLLSTMLIQSTQHSGFTDDLILLACAVSIGLYVLISFLAGEALVKLLGTSGLSIMTKVSGLLLTAIAVGFIADGLKKLFPFLAG